MIPEPIKADHKWTGLLINTSIIDWANWGDGGGGDGGNNAGGGGRGAYCICCTAPSWDSKKKQKTTKTEWDDLQILVRLKEMLCLFWILCWQNVGTRAMKDLKVLQCSKTPEGHIPQAGGTPWKTESHVGTGYTFPYGWLGLETLHTSADGKYSSFANDCILLQNKWNTNNTVYL